MLSTTARVLLVAVVGLSASTVSALAQGCRDYPYRDGIDPDQMAQNKYVATASANVSFDDVDSVKDAREEATLEAKAAISKFLNESILSDEVISKIVSESKIMSGAGKEAVRKEVIQRTKLLRNSSQALLKGVIVLGDCYTKGTEVRVTVGMKPESIAAAEGLSGRLSSPNGSSSKSGSATKQPLNNVDEYSNTKNLKKF